MRTLALRTDPAEACDFERWGHHHFDRVVWPATIGDIVRARDAGEDVTLLLDVDAYPPDPGTYAVLDSVRSVIIASAQGLLAIRRLPTHARLLERPVARREITLVLDAASRARAA